MHDSAPTKSPSHPGMASTFDRLAESSLELSKTNRELVKVMRLAMMVMVVLTLAAVSCGAYSAFAINRLVSKFSVDCLKEKAP